MKDLAAVMTTKNGGKWSIHTTNDDLGVLKEEYRVQPDVWEGEAFQILDDDNTHVFTGFFVMNDKDTGFEPLEWAANEYGATQIRYFNQDTQAWENL